MLKKLLIIKGRQNDSSRHTFYDKFHLASKLQLMQWINSNRYKINSESNDVIKSLFTIK